MAYAEGTIAKLPSVQQAAGWDLERSVRNQYARERQAFIDRYHIAVNLAQANSASQNL